MPRTTKTVKQVVTETFEFINITDKSEKPEIMYLSVTDGMRDKVVKVKPGGSVFLTQDDINKYISIEDKRFSDGRIIPKDTNLTKNVYTSNNMSENEIDVFVSNIEDAKELQKRIKDVASKPVLNLFLTYVSKHDKPVSYHKVVEARINEIVALEEKDKEPYNLVRKEDQDRVNKVRDGSSLIRR